MKTETLEKANSIQAEITKLNEKIKAIPSCTHRRFLLRYDNKTKFDRTYDGFFAISTEYYDHRIIELNDEDLKLFIALRRHKIEELESQLELLN